MPREVVKATGEISVNIPEVCIRNTEALPKNSDVTLDFSEVGELDSACCAMMVMMRRHLKVNGNTINFINLPDKLKRLVKLYELVDLLGLEDEMATVSPGKNSETQKAQAT